MELWIRSQDKNALRRINTSLYLKEDLSDYAKGSVWFVVSGGDKLGEYETKERALEVLDEIQKLIKPTFKINYEYDDSQPIIDGEWLKSLKAESKIEELSCYVYEMPKE